MSMSDYSDLEKEIEGAPEPKTLPKGTEVTARIIAVRAGVSDTNDCKWYQPVFDVPADPLVIEFNDFFWELDREHLSEKKYARALYDFKAFASAFSIDYSRPFDWEDDLPGKEGDMILGFKKDDEFGDKNTVKKYVMPR